MNAILIGEACTDNSSKWGYSPARPAKIRVDSELWFSEVPRNGGEAQTYNQQALAIVEKLNAR